MSEKNIVSNSALEQYRYFIDQLAAYFATHSILAKRILTEKEVKYSHDCTVSKKEIEELLKALSHEQQRTLAYLLIGDRDAGIHDTLNLLGELIDSGWRITYNGVPVPTDLSGEGPMYDYVSRRLRLWEWPNNIAQTPALKQYKYFIDQLAFFFVTNSVLAKRILTDEEFKYSYDYPDRYEDTTNMLKSLYPKQQKIVAYLILRERDSGIQDTLNLLGELIDKGWKIIWNGEPMPTGLTGEGPKGDYVTRRLGYDWLNDISQPTV